MAFVTRAHLQPDSVSCPYPPSVLSTTPFYFFLTPFLLIPPGLQAATLVTQISQIRGAHFGLLEGLRCSPPVVNLWNPQSMIPLFAQCLPPFPTPMLSRWSHPGLSFFASVPSPTFLFPAEIGHPLADSLPHPEARSTSLRTSGLARVCGLSIILSLLLIQHSADAFKGTWPE